MSVRMILRLLWLPLAIVATVMSWRAVPWPQIRPLPPIMADYSRTPAFHSQFIPVTTPVVHSSSMIILPEGDRLAFWFGGSREGATDVAIWQSRYHDGKWSAPQAIVRPENVSSDEWRYTRKLGNPVAVRLPNGNIQVFFVSVCLGGWAASSLNQILSKDDGVSWSAAKRLVTSPFLNISTLVRSRAVNLSDGGFYLPVYHELIHKFPEMLRFDKAGNLIDKDRMSNKHSLLQPAMVQAGDQRLISLLRDGNGQNIHVQVSRNAGKDWSAPQPLPLVNRDSSVAVARLADGRLLLVYNDGEKGREQLALAVSADSRSWSRIGWLEYRPGTGEEYSYPAIVVSGENIDVTYTWQRTQIKHVRFNLAWVKNKEVRP